MHHLERTIRSMCPCLFETHTSPEVKCQADAKHEQLMHYVFARYDNNQDC